MTHYVAAVERGNRYEVENAKYDVDHHHLIEQQAQWHQKRVRICGNKALRNAENDLLSHWRNQLNQSQQNHGTNCHGKIADRSHHRSEDVIQYRILEIPRVHRRGLRPTQYRNMEK